MVGKACPIVLRSNNDVIEILAFEHPTLDRQLVKGTIEIGELPGDAAIRELAEESGLAASTAPLYLGQSENFADGNHWYFYICDVGAPMPDNWAFYTEDEGGLLFRFFWHKLASEVDESWHPLYHEVLSFIRPLILKQY